MNRKRTWFPGLSILSLCAGAWAESVWEKTDISLLPQVQIAAHGGKAVAVSVSRTKVGYRYEDSLKAWVSEGALPGQATYLIREAHSAYTWNSETGKITPLPALPGQSQWPLLHAFPIRLGEDSLTQYAEFGGDLVYSEKARPGWKSATATPWGGAFGSVALLPDIVLAGTDSGVLVSEDRGRRWEHSQGLPREPMRVVGSGSGEAFAISSAGAAYRTKQGVQWERVFPVGSSPGSDQGWIQSILALGDTIWLSFSGRQSQSGVWRSVDAGKNWSLHQAGLGWNRMQSDDPKLPDERSYEARSIVHDGQALWVLSLHDYDARPFRSADGGRTWTRTDAGLTDQYYHKLFSLWGKLYAVYAEESLVSVWSFDPALNRWSKDKDLPQKEPGKGWGMEAVVDSDTAWLASGAELYRSVRGTGIWEVRSMPKGVPPTYPTEYRPIDAMAALGGEVLLLGRMGDGMNNFHFTDDGGHSWHTQRPFFPAAVFQEKRVEARGNRLVVLDPGAPRNPRLWRIFPDPIRFLDKVGERLVVRAGGKVFSAAAVDGAWRESALPDSSMELGIFQDTLTGFTREARWVSRNAGESWESRKIGFPSRAVLDMSVDDRGVWTLLENSFLYPTDTGYAEDLMINIRSQYSMMAHTGKWIILGGTTSFMDFYAYSDANARMRLADGKFGNKIPTALHGSGDFLVFAYQDGSLSVSQDRGVSHAMHNPGLGRITALAGKPDGLMALASGRVEFSGDSGKTWERIAAPDSLILFDGKDGLLAGLTARDSLVFSTDGGATWSREATLLPTSECTVLKVHGGTVYVGTRSQGVYGKSLSPTLAGRHAPRPALETPAGAVRDRTLKRRGWNFVDGTGIPRDLQGRKALP